jgi:hypothetical protein
MEKNVDKGLFFLGLSPKELVNNALGDDLKFMSIMSDYGHALSV